MSVEKTSNKDEEDLDGITEAIPGNLVLNDTTKGLPAAKPKLPVKKPTQVNIVACRDDCCHPGRSTPGLPIGYKPTPIPVKRVKIDEHGDTHEINIDGQGLVTVTYMNYQSEKQMKDIMSLITKDLSEPYSVYTYRYFIHNWPKLSFLAYCGQTCIGAIVCKLDVHKKLTRRGYIAMLAVDNSYRRHQIGSNLVIKAIRMMIEQGCDEYGSFVCWFGLVFGVVQVIAVICLLVSVARGHTRFPMFITVVVLETEITNVGALHLYENLGFVRDKRLFKYYLNGVDALRLKLWLS